MRIDSDHRTRTPLIARWHLLLFHALLLITTPALSSGGSRTIIWNGEREDGHVSYMLSPVVATLREGLEAWGHNVTTGKGMTPAFRRTTSSLGENDTFIFVGSISFGKPPWRSLRERKVRLVYYNTEPYGCSRAIRPSPIDEWWDYSRANCDSCSQMLSVAAVRFVPPGVIAQSPQVRNFANVGYGTGWTMLGRADASIERRRCFGIITAGLQRGREFFEVSKIWSNESFRAFVEDARGPLAFLSLHKKCGQPRAPFEAVRASQLLSAGALLFSENSYVKDMREYQDIVAFAPMQKNALRSAVADVLRLPPNERRARAEKAGALFRQRFAPSAIIERAQIPWV